MPRAARCSSSRSSRAVVSTILSSFRVPEIRKKLIFTAAILALYRLGSYIPVPGINTDAIDQIKGNYGANGGVLQLLNTFSGGGPSRGSLFAVGVLPYITPPLLPPRPAPLSPAPGKL